MAIHAHSTTLPAPQRGLLLAFRCLASATAESTPTPALTPETVAMLDALPAANDVAHVEALLLPPAPLPSLSAALSRRQAIFGTVEIDEPDTAAQARALHTRRELHQALEYGFALLDALDLPPLALDVIDDAIAHLDAIDAPTEDLEDEGLAEDGGDLEAVNEDGDPLDHGEHDGWRRPRRARVTSTEWPVAMAEREAQRLAVIAAVVTSPNVVRFPGRRANG